jgi:uncharacterized coiled-coil DUF342 family protein
MPATSSVMSLHLKYRLMIAELNFDITVLRIFGDYLNELNGKRKEAEFKSRSDHYEKELQGLRAEIDEIRHEMQLSKMKLATYTRETTPFDYKIFNKENHSPLKKRFMEYKANFKKISKELEVFEEQWLSKLATP